MKEYYNLNLLKFPENLYNSVHNSNHPIFKISFSVGNSWHFTCWPPLTRDAWFRWCSDPDCWSRRSKKRYCVSSSEPSCSVRRSRRWIDTLNRRYNCTPIYASHPLQVWGSGFKMWTHLHHLTDDFNFHNHTSINAGCTVDATFV